MYVHSTMVAWKRVVLTAVVLYVLLTILDKHLKCNISTNVSSLVRLILQCFPFL